MPLYLQWSPIRLYGSIDNLFVPLYQDSGFPVGIATGFERVFIHSYSKCRLFLLLVKLVVGKLLRCVFPLVVCSTLESKASVFFSVALYSVLVSSGGVKYSYSSQVMIF